MLLMPLESLHLPRLPLPTPALQPPYLPLHCHLKQSAVYLLLLLLLLGVLLQLLLLHLQVVLLLLQELGLQEGRKGTVQAC
jgi:hypothetical protein